MHFFRPIYKRYNMSFMIQLLARDKETSISAPCLLDQLPLIIDAPKSLGHYHRGTKLKRTLD
jgi:hypothetical protein